MKAEKIFFDRYHGISTLIEKGMPSDVLFEGKSFNIEEVRRRYIPYNCRCEAIGGGRDKGLLYRGLDGAWEISDKENASAYRRNFKISPGWKGYRLYLVVEEISPKTTVYINGALACFYFGSNDDGEKREYIESEITAHANFDLENEIVIISEEIESGKRCRASIIARKFVHIRDYDFEINDSSVNINIYMSKKISASVLAEVYDDDLNLITSVSREIRGEGNLAAEISSEVRLVLLVCGEEVIPIPTESHMRPDLPVGEEISTNYAVQKSDFEINALDLDKGIFDITVLGDDEIPDKTVLEYNIFSENGTIYSGESELCFAEDTGSLCRINIEYDVPSLSFYEYFIDFKIDGEFIKQFKFTVKQTACERMLSSDMPSFESLNIGNGKIVASGVNFEHVFDTEKGCLEKISKEVCDVLYGECLLSFEGIYADHMRSTVVSRDNHHVCISSVYSIKSRYGEFSVSILTIIFSDGEISVSVSGFAENLIGSECDSLVLTYPVSDNLLKSKVYGEIECNSYIKAGVYDCNSYSGEAFKACRWIYSYGDRVPGLLVKGMPQLDAKMSGSVRSRDLSPGISILIKPDKNGMVAASFVIKPVFCENEDIIREARTIPFVG
ncbi:MAG: hypothetical protein IJZ94_02245 [Clostridia bacterium]|nr:hypothetical protein [Clostridia bacterium]